MGRVQQKHPSPRAGAKMQSGVKVFQYHKPVKSKKKRKTSGMELGLLTS
jgi:hypothetical protein